MTFEKRPVVGVILAGGAGRRLGGVRKGDVRLANRPLVAWAGAALAPQCARVLLSVPNGRVGSSLDVEAVLPDPPGGIGGPCAGLLEAARWCARHAPGALLVSVSVDTPFFPADFVARAVPLLTAGTGCVVGRFEGRDYPINAVWTVSLLRETLEAVPPAPRGPRVRDVQRAIGTAWLDHEGDNPFAGVNTLADLVSLSRRAEQLGVGKRGQIG